MAAEAVRSGKVRNERKLFLTPTGLLMEGDYTHDRLLVKSQFFNNNQSRAVRLTCTSARNKVHNASPEVIMFRHILLLFVTPSLLTQSTPIKKDALPERYDITEAYAVYSAIVPFELADTNTVFIRTETELTCPPSLVHG
jgi:hypothetical protein